MNCHRFEFRVTEVRSIPEKEFRVAEKGGCMVLLPFLVGFFCSGGCLKEL
jgi:hypothetical protein